MGREGAYGWPRIFAFCAWNSASVRTPFARRSASRSSSLTVDGASGGVAGGDGPATRGHRPRGTEHPLLVHLALVVDRLLHVLRVADRLELLATRLARGLHDERPGADDPLEHALREPHVVDRLERDLHRVLRDQALAMDQPIARHHEVGRQPPGQPAHRVRDQQRSPSAPGSPSSPIRRTSRSARSRPRYDPDRRQRREQERDPVGPEVEHQLLAGHQQPLREGHSRTVPRGPLRGNLRRPGSARARCSTSPVVTVCVPPGVRTTRAPRSSTATASPRPADPRRRVTSTSLPSVAETALHASTTPAGSSRYPSRKPAEERRQQRREVGREAEPGRGLDRRRGFEVHSDPDDHVPEPSVGHRGLREDAATFPPSSSTSLGHLHRTSKPTTAWIAAAAATPARSGINPATSG